MRRSLARALPMLVALLLLPGAAEAQSCHAPSLRPAEGVSVRASLGASFAAYSNRRGRGDFQSLQALVALSHPWFFVDVAVPTYWLTRDGEKARGIGDVAADLRAHALRLPDVGITAGPEFALTVPTGDETRDLGMGHTMLMPGVFTRLELGPLTVMAQLAYGVARMHGAHAMHGGAAPIVNPMNRSELEHALGAGYVLHQVVRLIGRVHGAVPIAVPEGVAREVVAAGVQLVWDAFDVTIEQHLPIVGNPFTSKTQLALSGQW